MAKRVKDDMASIPGPSTPVRKDLLKATDAPPAAPAPVDRLTAKLQREERRTAATAREAAAMAGSRVIPNATRRVLKNYDREKPTREAQRSGQYEVVDAATFGDSDRKGDPVLVDLRSRAGGAGEMFGHRQIGKRELKAAVRLMELAERARASQVSGVALAERVDGGGPAGDGGRLAWAASAAGEYREATSRLSRLGRALVEWRVVMGKPMEEVVQLRSVAARLGADNSVRNRCNKALPVLVEALDALADHFGLGEG